MKWKDLNKWVDNIDNLKNQSPYDILRVDKSASWVEIRKAYRTLIKGYHPDIADKFLKSNNEEVLKIINSAYEVILKEKNAGK